MKLQNPDQQDTEIEAPLVYHGSRRFFESEIGPGYIQGAIRFEGHPLSELYRINQDLNEGISEMLKKHYSFDFQIKRQSTAEISVRVGALQLSLKSI